MATVVDRYSKLVAWLKIILPLMALAILSTLFLVSRGIDPSLPIPFSEMDAEDIADSQQVGAPVYSGVTTDGSAVSFRADTVTPEAGQGRRVFAERPSARIETASGDVFNLDSATGTLDRTAKTIAFEGDVVMTTSDGYRVESQRADSSLDLTRIVIPGPMHGTGPIGELDAGSAVIGRQKGEEAVMRFENGVNLIYRPAQ